MPVRRPIEPVLSVASQAVLSAVKLEVMRSAHAGLAGREASQPKGSLGALVASHVASLDPTQKRLLSRKVRRASMGTALRTFQATHGIEMRRPASVLSQLAKSAVFGRWREESLSTRSSALSTEGATGKYDGLVEVHWSIRSVFCRDETNGIFGTEGGRDTIVATGFGIDPAHRVQSWERYDRDLPAKWADTDTVRLGDFDDTVSAQSSRRFKTYQAPEMTLLRFETAAQPTFPLTYTAVLQLIEVDGSRDAKDATKSILEKAVEEAAKALSTEAGAEEGSAASNIISEILSAIADFVSDLFVGDDAFDPVTFQFQVRSPSQFDRPIAEMTKIGAQFHKKEISLAEYMQRVNAITLPTKTETVRLKDHGGTYDVEIAWTTMLIMGLG